MSYSNSGGGTLTLPSPTHVHHVDVTSAVRSLRRSLSRSPSKFRLVTKSPSSSPKSPLSPSPLSPPKRASSQNSVFSSNPPHTPSPLVPFPPSAKLALRSSSRAKTAPARPLSRRTSPKSPMKRVLNHTSDCGNATPTPAVGSVSGQENVQNISPVERKSFERVSKMTEVSAPINQALSRLGGDGASDFPPASTSSPLKRSDAIMNLDQASLGSPVAKRRSLHGSASFGHDFNVFDYGPAPPSFDIHDDTNTNQEYELSAASLAPENTSFTSMPRRSSSLRKSTLQQRHGEKTSWGRRHAAQLLAAQQLANANAAPEVSTPTKNKDRPRLSLDQFMPPQIRDSPFTSQGPLPNPSYHMLAQPTHQPHPLSRTMTTSSSSSSMMDESPTHIPPHFGEQPRPKLDFSKSLPAGSLRPFDIEQLGRGNEGSFATPVSYKNVKPFAAAFGSTGLVSKMRKNPEEPIKIRGVDKPVPDTPCKKPNMFATYPIPGSAVHKNRGSPRHSFGTPSAPFNPHGNSLTSTFGKPPSVFGGVFGHGTSSRRGSFLSIDGDESGGSPDAKGDSQSSNDFDFPPTPTKQNIAHLQFNGSPSNPRIFPASTSAVGNGLFRNHTRTSSKLNVFTGPADDSSDESDESTNMNDSPSLGHSRASYKLARSKSSQRTLTANTVGFTVLKALSSPIVNSPTRSSFAKTSHVAPASPLERIDFMERLSPQTPSDSMLPPDPSGLSISGRREPTSKAAKRNSMPPPATPKAGVDYFSKTVDRRLSTTPVSTFAPTEVDDSLNSRFDKAEMVGSGEFSRVFRVTKFLSEAEAMDTPMDGSQSPPPKKVYAVKKSRQPYSGIRDRQRKLQEVNVLKALGRSDHVVCFVDSWEEKNYLYIQTEFCEEGSLDIFLANVGRKGRIDPFRIWKFLLEMTLGLKHIHDTGYIHLDMKPANIFITFEGVLKIGDFGMASSWPAPPGIEGEGDREYIGPEVLLGQFDKPADIFALGIMMIEIAGNVQLPENGPSWARLRSGDMSDAPSLTFSSASALIRDATGTPITQEELEIPGVDTFGSDDEIDFGSPTLATRKKKVGSKGRSTSHDPGNLFGSLRRGELHRCPRFMRDATDPDAIDNLVRWMIQPNPQNRPTIQQVLEAGGVAWTKERRRAAATVFEGNWGPADTLLSDDAEMMDV